MTTRRNFLKGIAMAATPFAALTLGSKNAEAASKNVGQVCLRCSERETPCFCRTPTMRKLSSRSWRKTDDNYYSIGDTYLNDLDLREYTYTVGENGYPNFWRPHFGMMCHICLRNARLSLRVKPYDAMLSVVCNTCPPYTTKWEGTCCCGHPWLKTATEDYVRHQEGESDQDRERRRNYPTIHLWERYRHCGMFNSAPAIMGVDQIAPFMKGDTLRYHYRVPNSSGHGVANWNELADIMRYRQIQMCVIDPDPETNEARKFRRLFPEHVAFCQYRQWVDSDLKFLSVMESHPALLLPSISQKVNDLKYVYANRSYWYRGDHPTAFCEIARELECARRYESDYNRRYM